MQSLRRCITGINQNVMNGMLITLNRASLFHTSSALQKTDKSVGPQKFLSYNKTIFPPTKPDEPERPAYVCHVKTYLKYSPKKLWYLACFVRGMSVDEAIKQLSFMLKKGSVYIMEAIKEAQELAVENHNVEYKSNLWVAESFVGKAHVVKGLRRHARIRQGIIEYKYCHYFVRLEEGPPPKHYYPAPLTPQEQLDEYLAKMHKRKIISSL